jgi:hypothetical protein
LGVACEHEALAFRHDGRPGSTVAASTRLIRRASTGAAQVTTYTLQNGAVDGATEWYAFDLHSDGTTTDVGITEKIDEDVISADLPCIETVYSAL